MDGPRALPIRPSLRFLRLEAKRRLAAGEFRALHEAQLQIAREHGLPSWPALKALVGAHARPADLARSQLQWVISRFADAERPDWIAPTEQELRRYFASSVLARRPPVELIETIAAIAPRLRGHLEVEDQTRLSVRAHVAGVEIIATVDPEPPHRLTVVRPSPLRARITDRRIEPAPTTSVGHVPQAAKQIGAAAFHDLGLVGLLIAGGGRDRPQWIQAHGWASIEPAEPLRRDHRFPVYGITQPVTATAVLRLVGEGRIGLDDPANKHLRSVRLGDDGVTVRELLTHTGGVDHPVQLADDSVPELASLTGRVIACSGQRGRARYSNEGYAVLGQLITDVTGAPYPAAMDRMVLSPLGMRHSSFPTAWRRARTDGVTGYDVSTDGTFVPETRICTLPAAGGLWATADDLIRFALRWPTLLPDALVRAALQPKALGPVDAGRGLGWQIDTRTNVNAANGTGPGATASLLARIRRDRIHIILTNRQANLAPISEQLLRIEGT